MMRGDALSPRGLGYAPLLQLASLA